MPLSETTRAKILLIEEVINFPPSLLFHKNYHWENLPMVSYSDLTGAVSSLVENGKKVVIITGFYIPAGDPPATETDGPPGALMLAEGLKYLGMEVSLLSDEYTLSTLKAGLKVLHLTEKEIPVICFPLEHSDQDDTSRMINEENETSLSIRFAQDFFSSLWGQSITHLIYIERVGPNYTLDSLRDQKRQAKPPLQEFEVILPPPIRNRCFSSRLEDITRFTAKTHFLLELAERLKLPMESIGIGDRGNEIGAGKIPWEVFKQSSMTNREAVFCSRVKTDYLISCGISNWGGYALLAGVALAKGKLDVLEKVTPEQEGMVLDYLVRHGPAIDGITCRQDRSVDGIEFDEYMRVIERIKEIAFE
ncbi:MAG TPA: glutamate cyclase domain-containing protein [Thermodesulfobacteriota bacterium]|nr:glutamate cyclase domain-containing protein [Thermodesulfobacteriota bacterium]